MKIDNQAYDSLMSLINWVSEAEYEDFIRVYSEETGIELDKNNSEEVDLCASKWDNHIYCDVVKVYDWLRRETISELN